MDLPLEILQTRQPQEMGLHFLCFSRFEMGVERARVTHGRGSVPEVNTVLSTDHKCLLGLLCQKLDGSDQQSPRAPEEGELE